MTFSSISTHVDTLHLNLVSTLGRDIQSPPNQTPRGTVVALPLNTLRFVVLPLAPPYLQIWVHTMMPSGLFAVILIGISHDGLVRIAAAAAAQSVAGRESGPRKGSSQQRQRHLSDNVLPTLQHRNTGEGSSGSLLRVFDQVVRLVVDRFGTKRRRRRHQIHNQAPM